MKNESNRDPVELVQEAIGKLDGRYYGKKTAEHLREDERLLADVHAAAEQATLVASSFKAMEKRYEQPTVLDVVKALGEKARAAKAAASAPASSGLEQHVEALRREYSRAQKAASAQPIRTKAELDAYIASSLRRHVAEAGFGKDK
jgi:hypothetical protein